MTTADADPAPSTREPPRSRESQGRASQVRASQSWADLNWAGAHRCEIQMRYGDVDGMGHVNNARYAEYLEVARMRMSADLGLGEVDDLSVLARLELDYVAEIRLGQAVVVESLIERLGRTSWTVVSRFLADGVPGAYARSVQVSVDAAHRPRALPEWFRQRVADVLVGE